MTNFQKACAHFYGGLWPNECKIIPVDDQHRAVVIRNGGEAFLFHVQYGYMAEATTLAKLLENFHMKTLDSTK